MYSNGGALRRNSASCLNLFLTLMVINMFEDEAAVSSRILDTGRGELYRGVTYGKENRLQHEFHPSRLLLLQGLRGLVEACNSKTDRDLFT